MRCIFLSISSLSLSLLLRTLVLPNPVVLPRQRPLLAELPLDEVLGVSWTSVRVEPWSQ